MSVTKLTVAPGVDQYTLINKSKTLAVMILTRGAVISHILTPDKTGQIRDVALGFDEYEGYNNPSNPYFGAVVGRFGNRIAEGKFSIDDKQYTLAINNGPNSLHGGLDGFDKRIWTATVVSESPAAVRLELISPDGDQGYPGTLTTQLTYTVTDKDELILDYRATTDQDTVLNLTNHSYFNLAGVELNSNVLDHRVTMTDEVKAVLECDANCLPTGKILSWSDAPWMNFSGENAGKPIGARLENLEGTRGYDHPYVIHNEYKTDTAELPLRHAVNVYAPETGIELDFSTTEPAFQFYTGGWIAEDKMVAKKAQAGVKLGRASGFCLEASRNPDSPNKPDWRSAVLLKKDGLYTQKTVYAFHARLD